MAFLVIAILWILFMIAIYKEWIDELVAIVVVIVLGAATIGIM